MRILVADDERDLNALIAQKLRKEHYSVDCCHDGEEALEYLRMADYDAVVLDIMMPKKDGISVLKELRANGSHVPVLLLTAKDSIEDRVLGLDAGADDYLIKPFAYEELMARLRVLLRSPLQNKTSVLQVGDLTLHLDTHQVQRAGKDITLSSKEYAVLSRERLEQHIWNYDYSGGSNVIDVYIRYLRKKIDEGHDIKLIRTVRGAGYVLKADA